MTSPSSPATREEGELEMGVFQDESSALDDPASEVTCQDKGNVDDPSREQNLVWWNEPAEQDPANPMSWPTWRKWTIIANLSFITFLT
jgi:hypothetical protein